jgi:hypothetical protein
MFKYDSRATDQNPADFEVLTRNPKISPGNPPKDDDATVQVVDNRFDASGSTIRVESQYSHRN